MFEKNVRNWRVTGEMRKDQTQWQKKIGVLETTTKLGENYAILLVENFAIWV